MTIFLKLRLQNIYESMEKHKSEQSPESTLLAQYYQGNLQQLESIFYISIGVMIAGFMVICYSILILLPQYSKLDNSPPSTSTTEVNTLPVTLDSLSNNNLEENLKSSSPNSSNYYIFTIISGIITEFIGATFLFIYRSTIEQSGKYTEILQKHDNQRKILDEAKNLLLEDQTFKQLENTLTDEQKLQLFELYKKTIETKHEIAKTLISIQLNSSDNNQQS